MEFSEVNLLEILQEAAKSPLGIIALVILTMSIVGVTLFRNSEDKYKFGVFVVLLVGIVTFTYASLQTAQPINITDQDFADGTSVGEESSPPNREPGQSLDAPDAEQSGQTISSERSQEEGFIYLGTYRNGKWSDPRFIGAAGELAEGDLITLSDSRKMFECAPYRKSIFSFKYTYCNDVIGNVEKGGKVEILKQPVSVGLDRIWVYVREVKE